MPLPLFCSAVAHDVYRLRQSNAPTTAPASPHVIEERGNPHVRTGGCFQSVIGPSFLFGGVGLCVICPLFTFRRLGDPANHAERPVVARAHAAYSLHNALFVKSENMSAKCQKRTLRD